MFSPASGLNYRRFLRQMHARIPVEWYMEIGCRTGDTLAGVTAKTIGVDPFFRVEANVIRQKPVFMAFQQTSDEFFASKFLERNDVRLSLSFLDGMHLFEYLLRDFIGTERNSLHEGAILMHDCCPSTEEMTTRDLDNLPKGAWTGDVWKILPILQRWRPDLIVDVLDCSPTGIVIVRNLDPDNRVLEQNYDEIIATFSNEDGIDAARSAYLETFSYLGAREYLSGGGLFSTTDLHRKDDQKAPEYVTP
ncbi:class I SAM-dependent methyltransferase [Pontivivens insulae]|uniref:Class I SAM-dependent methyltransferase n=1 Tax=Pontivivens insulae TaxID=1639689 RepID=A0A2R8A7W4_9RHOB|nr:class I SAM-dependent methyltransferase [Pontivivens insulae]RED18423.1 hypothetical protein DFR53_0618 [Pontivivens insulae]SPF28321.1 hypothetical protein POI8812_00619 [Pontivivens insulae]